jgi:hypothetical protein
LSSKFVILAVGLIGLAVGCDTVASVPKAGSVFIALDTSESAGIMQGKFGTQISDELMALPLGVHTMVFRFDSSPAEVYAGKPCASRDEAANLIKTTMKHRSQTRGTNMAKLVTLFAKRLEEVPSPVEVRIYTDCGVELMSKADKERVRKTTAAWATDPRISGVKIIGLRSGYREEVRDLVQLGPDKLELLTRDGE